ncbi:MAG: anti-sigma-K factor RskA [Glaciecola sp.]|jgi:anti-sigma-K factor RskA
MTQDLHTLAGPYALNSLPRDEAHTFEEHLAACAPCRAEVAQFRDAAGRLGGAIEATLPADMRSAVMRQISMTRQDAPKVVTLAAPAVSPFRRLALPAAAAIAVIAVGLAFALGSLTGRVSDLQDREQMLQALLASSDVAVVHGSGQGALAALVASPSRGEAIVSFSNLEHAPANSVYSLWLITAGGPVPAGLFDADDAGNALTVMRGDMSDTEVIAVTIEPTGGSAQPTTVPFLILDLTA